METNMQFFVLNSTSWFCLCLAEHQESVQCRRIQMSDEVTSLSLMPQPCRFPYDTFRHAPIYVILQWDEAALDSKPALPVCPSVPETLNLWGQSRSQVRSSGTGLHSVSTRRTEKMVLGSGFHSWWSSSDRRCSRHCHLYYHRTIVRRHNVTLTSTVCPRRDQDASSWTRRWPPLLLQHRPSQGTHPIGWLCVIALIGAQ